MVEMRGGQSVQEGEVSHEVPASIPWVQSGPIGPLAVTMRRRLLLTTIIIAIVKSRNTAIIIVVNNSLLNIIIVII